MRKRRSLSEIRRQLDVERGNWESDAHTRRLAEAQVIARQRSKRVVHELRQIDQWLGKGLSESEPQVRRSWLGRRGARLPPTASTPDEAENARIRLRTVPCADGLAPDYAVSHDPASRLLVIDYRLPALDVIPPASSFKVDKTTADVVAVKRSTAERNARYQDLVSQVTLRCLHVVFGAAAPFSDSASSDAVTPLSSTETVVFNGFVESVDVASGHLTRACLLSLRVTRAQFDALDLRRVDAVACLRSLHAAVSPRPAELVAVAPIMQLDLRDARFIDEDNVLGRLETRPNLLELTPSEFESLITNLFTCMGLETRLTQASRDGGVDCVAFDLRPVLGGKVVIQAKRYSNTVGVAAVRDLYGTVLNEGAGKGILVTTSGYGPAAYEFAAGKPLELLTGANLLALLHEWAGIDARIVPVAPVEEDFTASSSTEG